MTKDRNIITRWLNYFLRNYDPLDIELFLTARFVLIVIISIICLASAMMVHGIYQQSANSMVIPAQVLNLIMMVVSLVMLTSGYYTVAVHTLFITVFSTIWAILFFGTDDSVIIKLDTIVLVIGMMAALPIISLKNRKPMIIYFSLNMILFLIYNYDLIGAVVLTPWERLDYFLDNFVAIVFVFLVSFNLFKINQKTLTSLKQELTDRKKAEEALMESRHQLAVHLENTPVGAISWDPEFRVTEWNPSAETIFGFSKEEAVGNHITALILPEDLTEEINTVFRNVLSERGEGRRSINENITRSGKRILCEWYNTVLKTTDGRIIGVASLVNDITERRKTQEMMIQSEKMMSVGGLAAGMAHEISNPLAGIMQNAQVIHQRLTQNIPANARAAEEAGTSTTAVRHFMEKREILKLLGHISQAGHQTNEIIKNMLSFSKKSDMVRKEVYLSELIDSTLDLVKNDASFKKRPSGGIIEIVREYSPVMPAVFCEQTKIQQVLFNLLKNAAESMNSKTYENEPALLTIRLKKNPSNAQIEVEDNGAGMDTETCKRVFEPFFTTKGPEKGTGLGLSISYFIVVEDHGGQMAVDSTPGKGTRFTVRLPIRAETF